MNLLKKGNKGNEVRILQEFLNLYGANLNIDDDFGTNTVNAVKNFQKSHFDQQGQSLEVDGILGETSWQALLDNYPLQEETTQLKPKVDKPTKERIKLVHPALRGELDKIYEEIRNRGVAVRFTSTLRTFEEQEKLYAQGRTRPGQVVTNARAGQSYHNYGLAVDFCLLLEGGKKVSWNRSLDLDHDGQKDWDEVVFVFKMYEWKWGGDWTSFKDYPHFQKTFSASVGQLLAKYNNNEIENDYVKLT